MQKNQYKNTKGLILAVSIVIGTVIGTGIFFKNESMIAWAHGKAWVVISAWIIGSIIALAAAVSFSQIARRTKNSNSGIGQLTHEMVNKKMGWHTKINWAFYYFPWNTILITLYASKYIVKITKNDNSIHTLLILCISALILFSFLFINIMSDKISNYIQISTTIIKIIPLIILSLGAIILVFVLPKENWWNGSGITPYNPVISNDTKGWNPLLIIMFIVPGTLFAYDSFINATNVSESVKKKHITYAIVGGMIFIAIIYLLVTVAILSTGTLNVENAFIKLFGGSIKHTNEFFAIIKKIIQIFILISALGAANGFCLAWTKTMGAVLKKKTAKNKFIAIFFSLSVIGLPLFLITLIIYSVNYIPASLDNISDASAHAGKNIGISFVDAFSNPLVIIAYSIYSITLIFSVIKNVKNKKQKYAWWFNYTALFAAIMIMIILGYVFFFSILYKALSSSSSTFGGLPGWVFLIIVTIYVILWFALPFLIRKMKKNFINDIDDFVDKKSLI